MQYLTFRLNGVEYAVDVKIIETVVEYEGSTSVPSPIDYMIGVMDLRGRLIPVVDLRMKLGLGPSAGAGGASVIVLSREGDGPQALTVGVLVDEVSEVVTIDEGQIQASGRERYAFWDGYVRGVVRHEGRVVVLIEAEGLFSAKELESLDVA
jgi:purine-binding chemotaxis protein CheW